MADTDKDPSPQMLEHLNLLLEMDIFAGEPDWKVIENLKSAQIDPEPAIKKGDEEDEND